MGSEFGASRQKRAPSAGAPFPRRLPGNAARTAVLPTMPKQRFIA